MIKLIITFIKNFAIIPNIHPILFHFTIALFSVAFVMYFLKYIIARKTFKSVLGSEFDIVARWCLWLSMFFVILTVLAGLQAYCTVPHNEDAHTAMEVHETAAIISFILIILVGMISVWMFRQKRHPCLMFIVGLLITQISVLITGYLGAEVVYRYGVGVIKAQTKGMMIGHKHHSYHDDKNEHNEEYNTANIAKDKQPEYWIDPMKPMVHYNKPGKSAMGMALIPVYYKPAGLHQLKNSIILPQAYIDNLGVVTTTVTNANMANSISTYAYVQPAETNIGYVTVYANAWVRNLVVKSLGAQVKKDQLLAQVYSPTIINAEEEYLMASKSTNKTLSAAALKKLSALHVADNQIQQLQKNQIVSQLINIYAPQDGVISALNIREGDYITPDTKLFNIVDLSSVWLIAAVFEKQAQWLKVGNTAVAKFTAYPDKRWEGEVEYIYPDLDPQTRSLKARLRFENPEFLLKPNMYGNIIIASNPKLGSLNIPNQAVIRESNDNRVIVSLGNGMFQVRKIVIGHEINGMVEVLSGLSLGESVVQSGEFMLDSEANLSAASTRLNNTTTAGTQHN